MAEKHFYEQKKFTNEYLLPYFQKYISDFHNKKILEVGCAEGGLLEVMHELSIYSVGLEISAERAFIAKEKNPHLKVIVGDIMDMNLPKIINEKFDLIIMREVIEHIPNKYAAFDNLERLLNPNGYLFMSFPPKRSPFAGHQQIGRSLMKAVPYLHVLPASFLKICARILKEDSGYIDEIKHHFSTGCTISEFERQSKTKFFVPTKKDLFLFRPIYALRFGLPTIKLPNIPLLREYISMGCEVLLQKRVL
jgi:2-polyprenyl-3-methyl-5-hydroxy-6-metoxy-1,4-benzoquinol methylase